jgi:UDP-N-acetyl-D-galactosamine dehydrogenase
VTCSIHDSFANHSEVQNKFDIKLITKFDEYDAIILAVSHNNYKSLDFQKLKKTKESVIYDVKSILDRKIIDARL